MKLSRINTLLLIAIIVVNAYVVFMPITPAILFWFQSQFSATEQRLNRELHFPASTETEFQSENRLIIPSMLLNQVISEGKDMRALDKGPWRRPGGSTPDKGSNTVIVGHRFTYTNPRGSFYYLDKLKVGDEVGVIWQARRYIYKVDSVKVVSPSRSEVEAPTKDKRLTLYTCTPLWLPHNRLVVTAKLEKTL